MMVKRVFDAHVFDKRYLLRKGTFISITSVTIYLGQKGESRRRDQTFIDQVIIGRFRKKEVVDRMEGQHYVELAF